MNYRTLSLLTLLIAGNALGQGSLTPPGAPGTTMKTLAQVEPRTAIATNIYTISQPGSYYLATNMTGLSIQAGDVTVDLMGFSISAPSGTAIYFYNAYTNVVIRNGSVRSGSGHGISCNYTSANARMLIENIRIQGAANTGILLPSGSVVRNCEIYGCPSGINSAGAVDVLNCILEGNTHGLILGSGSQVIGNTIRNNNGTGLWLTGTNAYVADNIVKGNADNYNLAAGNQLNLLLSQIPETLDWPCSVKLAGTLACTQNGTNGITVNANDVTIDLAGHTLIGPGANSGSGIYQSDVYRGLRVFNGKVVGWRGSLLVGGIYALGQATILSDLQAATNLSGIVVGNGSTLSDCAASSNGADGINTGDGCTLSGCAASNNGEDGINVGDGCTLSGCSAYNNIQNGIWAHDRSTLSSCATSSNGEDGINAGDGCTLSDCAAIFNTSDGISVDFDTRVEGCACDNNGFNGDGAGIHAGGYDNRIEGNNCTDNDRGIDVNSAGNFIARNTCSGNSLNWDVAAGNVCLVVSATTGGAISGDAGGAAPGSTDPNANFTF